ncbi:hypothetical protein WN55_00778 [Dufourea novaeangliae]|uniref:Uncharacterized protein n=1 Tax=Dufourea novaeangliae TaxID=178035 RepID=A0A154PCM0_DUFNO|nr:hypothetical protein WN55_00778 [Dufourea novaeangliae]
MREIPIRDLQSRTEIRVHENLMFSAEEPSEHLSRIHCKLMVLLCRDFLRHNVTVFYY